MNHDGEIADNSDDDDEPEVEGSVFGLFTVVALILPIFAWWGFSRLSGAWQGIVLVLAIGTTIYAFVVFAWILLALNLGRIVKWVTRNE